MVPEFKVRRPTSLSQEADGQLKNKDTVSIGHSKGKFASISVHAISNFFFLNSKHQNNPQNRRKMLPISHELMVAE